LKGVGPRKNRETREGKDRGVSEMGTKRGSVSLERFGIGYVKKGRKRNEKMREGREMVMEKVVTRREKRGGFGKSKGTNGLKRGRGRFGKTRQQKNFRTKYSKKLHPFRGYNARDHDRGKQPNVRPPKGEKTGPHEKKSVTCWAAKMRPKE